MPKDRLYRLELHMELLEVRRKGLQVQAPVHRDGLLEAVHNCQEVDHRRVGALQGLAHSLQNLHPQGVGPAAEGEVPNLAEAVIRLKDLQSVGT